MSPNHLDLDQAIEELKSERPTGDRRERALGSLVKPRRVSLKLPGLAAAVVVAITLLVLTKSNALAWSEVLRKTQQASNLHVTHLNAQGQITGEQWRSGTMWALWVKDESGRLICENRSDTANFYYFLYRRDLTAPNAVQYGTLWNQRPRKAESKNRVSGPAQTIDQLLSSPTAKLVSQEKGELDGKVVQSYVLKGFGNESITVDADPKTNRILLVHLVDGEKARFEYPESIDPRLFSFRARLSRDVAVLDLRGKEDPKKLPPYMPQAIASKGGIQLREVSVSPEGDLFIFWTGYLPRRDGPRRPQVVGVKTGAMRWFGYYKDGVHPVSGPLSKRLICYRVTLPEKIGDRLTIRIPTASSYVEFKDVAVKKPQRIKDE